MIVGASQEDCEFVCNAVEFSIYTGTSIYNHLFIKTQSFAQVSNVNSETKISLHNFVQSLLPQWAMHNYQN